MKQYSVQPQQSKRVEKTQCSKSLTQEAQPTHLPSHEFRSRTSPMLRKTLLAAKTQSTLSEHETQESSSKRKDSPNIDERARVQTRNTPCRAATATKSSKTMKDTSKLSVRTKLLENINIEVCRTEVSVDNKSPESGSSASEHTGKEDAADPK